MGLKEIYFGLEDGYYSLLDKIQKVIPVYSIVDPVDKILPSFAIVLALVFLLLAGGLFSILGGLTLGGSNATVSLSFNDITGLPIQGLTVSLNLAEGATPPAGDLAFPLSKETSSQGKVSFSVPPGSYVVQVNDPAYEPLSQDIEVTDSTSKIFSLKALVVPAKTRTLLIQDASQNVLGIPTSLPISLSFSCQSGTPPLPQTVYSGNVSIEQPASCSGLSVTVTANGFITKTQVVLGDTTVISMQSSADLGPDTNPPPTPTGGTVEVYAKSPTAVGIDNVQVKLFKVPPVGSNILADQTLTDGSGFSLFENVTPGKYVAVLAKVGFKQTTSEEFNVVAGETNTINVSLIASSTSRKVFVKLLNQTNQAALSGVKVVLFVQTPEANYLEYDSYTSDVNGVVDHDLADFNGNTKLVVTFNGFITQILSNTGIANADDVNPIPILLEPAAPPSANGTISNGVIADVKVVDEIGFPVLNADAHLYTPDANGVLVGTLKTNASGIAHFTNLPPLAYQATASTSSSDGTSMIITGSKGQIITLQVPLSLGSALVEVTVKTEQNQIVSDANVSILNYATSALQAKSSTNAQGFASLGVLSGQTVLVKVEKPGYLAFYSVPFDILKDNTHKFTIEVSLTSATASLDMSLTSIYQISTTGAQTLAQSIASGGNYAFHFSVKSPVPASGMKAIVRLNGTTPTLLSSDVGQIVDAESTQGGVGFYTAYTASDEFSPTGSVSSGTASKIVLNTLGDVNGGAYELIVFVTINPLAVPNVDKLKINFQSKSSDQASALYESTYTIGQNIPAQGDFLYLFFVTKEGSTEKVQVTASKPAILEQNKNYTLEYLITNVSGLDFAAATANFAANGSITSTPSLASLPGFANTKSVGGSVTIKSTQTCSSDQTYCSSILVSLGNVGTGKQPTTYTLQFFTAPEKAITLNTSPSFLLPNTANQVVQVTPLDNLSVPMTTLGNGVMISAQIQDSLGVNIGTTIPFTESLPGIFIASIPSAPSGSSVMVTGTASGYLSSTKSIPVSTNTIISLSEDFSCVTITLPSTPFVLPKNTNGNMVVSTLNCPEGITLFTQGEGSISVPVSNQGVPLSEISNPPLSGPLTLGPSATATLTAKAPQNIGIYPIYFQAKFNSQSSYSTIKSVDLIVKPAFAGENCLDLSSYSFDVTDGSDAATVSNVCNPLVKDAFLPSATIDSPNVYAHALPSLLTPEMKSPGTPVAFDWQLLIDYAGSNSMDTNFFDYPSLDLSDANWTRYYVGGGDNFLKNKSAFNGAEVTTIPDSTTCPQGPNGNFPYLETPDKPCYDFVGAGAKDAKSLLYETTLLVRKAVTLDNLCFPTTGVDDVLVLLDGVPIQSKAFSDCSNSPIKNIDLAAGPHALQIFVQDSKTGDYSIGAAYKDSKLTNGAWKPLSYKFASTGLRVSTQSDVPFSSSQFTGNYTNGPYVFPESPAHGTIKPNDNHSIPFYLGTVTGPIADILSNKSGAEHEKSTYVRFTSSNPQVRVFMKDLDVYGQFVGYDDPATDSQKQQYVVVENTSLTGTQYTTLHLSDYETPSPGNTAVDVGVLVDPSSSVLGKEYSLTSGSGSQAVGKQNGLCAVLANLKDGLQYYSGATVNFKVFWMNKPTEYVKAGGALPCSGIVSSEILSVSNPTVFDTQKDSNEFWARGAEVLASNKFWTTNNTHLMVVVTDNRPLGLGPKSKLNDWDGTQEQDAVDTAVGALKTGKIRGAVLYSTPIESTSIGFFGDPGKNDAIEMMQRFSSNSSPNSDGSPGLGVVEAMEFSQFMSSGLVNNSDAWEQSANNKVVQRLAQFLFPVGTQDVVVKLIASPANACIGENAESGLTGTSALPRVQFNWGWSKVAIDACDRKASDPSNYLYCDGVQFLISLSKKLEDLENTTASTASVTTTQYDAYLIRDNFNQALRNDLVAFETTGSFADAPDYFKGSLSGAWKDYYSSSNRLKFIVNGDASATKLPASGLYRVSISFASDVSPPSFFVAGSPSATITVSLTLLAPASTLPSYTDFYEVPFDGLVGLNEQSLVYERDDYGTAFTGNNTALLAQTDNSYLLKTYASAPGFTALNTYSVNNAPSFVQLNSAQRGVLLVIDQIAQSFTINPSVPTPLLGEWSTDTVGKGDLYYGVQAASGGQFVSFNTGSQGKPLSTWKPVASLNKQPTLGCSDPINCAICLDGSGKGFTSSVIPDANPIPSQSCSLLPAFSQDPTRAFGFHASGGTSNKVYLSSVLYSDVSFANVESGQIQDYSVWLACNSNSASPVGKLVVGDQVLDKGGQSAGLVLSANPSLQNTWDSARIVSNMVDMIGKPTQTSDNQGWTCLATQNGKTVVYWNVDQLYQYAQQGGNSFSDYSGNACTATGAPLSSSGIWTLGQQNDVAISSTKLTTTQAKTYCPLWTNKPAFNYYAQSGVPFPVGTQRFMTPGAGSGVVTNDSLNNKVQYRSDAQNCPASGTSAVTAACLSGNTPACQQNDQRIWANSP